MPDFHYTIHTNNQTLHQACIPHQYNRESPHIPVFTYRTFFHVLVRAVGVVGLGAVSPGEGTPKTLWEDVVIENKALFLLSYMLVCYSEERVVPEKESNSKETIIPTKIHVTLLFRKKILLPFLFVFCIQRTAKF